MDFVGDGIFFTHTHIYEQFEQCLNFIESIPFFLFKNKIEFLGFIC